ncbi:MAG: DUF177 domain-containing protein [Betaproteobacteria bacterium]
MSSQVKITTFDSLKLVHDRQCIAGSVPVAGLLRLAEGLQSSTGNLDFQIQGDVDGGNRPLLRLRVSGAVQLQCQRCLDDFDCAVDIDMALRLVAADALDTEYDDNPEEPDCIAASTALDLMALIEDEVLLALPAYPRHETGRCKGQMGVAGNADAAGAKIMGLSALQGLRQKMNSSKE